MTAIDNAIQAAMEDGQKAPAFYDLFFETEFLVPTHDTQLEPGQTTSVDLSQDDVEIMVLRHETGPVVPIFDTRDRLVDWARGREKVPYLMLTGRQLLDGLATELLYVLNPGTRHTKLFVREELDMLRQQGGGSA